MTEVTFNALEYTGEGGFARATYRFTGDTAGFPSRESSGPVNSPLSQARSR